MAKFDLNTRRVRVDVEIFESAKNNLRIQNIRILVDGLNYIKHLHNQAGAPSDFFL